jgi:hypothetical protein
MDPNATLQELRDLVLRDYNVDCARMVELFDALDNWLSTGEALPRDWERGVI